jgi:hypothetical protein
MPLTAGRQVSLVKLIRMLVEECGYTQVQKALSEVSGTDVSSEREKVNREASRRKKPTAVELVHKLTIPDREREIILVIAGKFDRKEFLPSIVDIREFLSTRGEEPSGVKDRMDGFRRLLRLLSQLPREKLEGLANSSRYAGPAQLGPLSDAIRTTGEAIRRNEGKPEQEKS